MCVNVCVRVCARVCVCACVCVCRHATPETQEVTGHEKKEGETESRYTHESRHASVMSHMITGLERERTCGREKEEERERKRQCEREREREGTCV